MFAVALAMNTATSRAESCFTVGIGYLFSLKPMTPIIAITANTKQNTAIRIMPAGQLGRRVVAGRPEGLLVHSYFDRRRIQRVAGRLKRCSRYR